MPFTPAHAAAVLPFAKSRWFSSTALLIGSMAPDAEYFLRLQKHSLISHTLPGILLFNLPVTILLSLVFHTLLREPVIRHLPLYLRQKALAVHYPNWVVYLRKNRLMISVSALLGIGSHLIWDSFTSNTSVVVQHMPILQKMVQLPLLTGPMMACRLVQHISTVVGLAAIAWSVYRLPAAPVKQYMPQHWPYFWEAVFALGVVFLFLNLILRFYIVHVLASFVITLISGWLLALLLVGSLFRLKRQA